MGQLGVRISGPRLVFHQDVSKSDLDQLSMRSANSAGLMSLSGEDLTAIWLTLQFAAVVTALLLLFGTPLAGGSTRSGQLTRCGSAIGIAADGSGFFVVAMGPSGPLGAITDSFGLDTLAFSFSGRSSA